MSSGWSAASLREPGVGDRGGVGNSTRRYRRLRALVERPHRWRSVIEINGGPEKTRHYERSHPRSNRIGSANGSISRYGREVGSATRKPPMQVQKNIRLRQFKSATALTLSLAGQRFGY